MPPKAGGRDTSHPYGRTVVMRHGKRGRKLGVVGAHRRAMAKNMIQSLIDNERVITTIPKAKHIQPLAEKVINLAKEKTLNNVVYLTLPESGMAENPVESAHRRCPATWPLCYRTPPDETLIRTTK